MKQLQLKQGSPEWLAHRASHFNASDAPAMMGVSPYKTRSQLLKELHTGLSADVDAATRDRWDDGHRFEALARPLAEAIIGDDLYPVVGVEGKLSASFDGLTMMEDVGFEHKSLNATLREAMTDGCTGADLPMVYQVQLEHQHMVSGAERTLFMASKWDEYGGLIEGRNCWYTPNPELAAKIAAGWDQFERDLCDYVLPEPAVATAAVGRAPDTLPALRIEVTGAVTASNLAEFKQTALDAIRSVNRELKTDADFADADKAVKWCGDVESRLKAAKEHALSQTADIDALFKALDDIGAEARTVRLDLEKLVKRRKDEVREQAVIAARRALEQHIADLQAELAPMRLQPVAADFPAAIKGLRSIASMQDALDTTLAGAKIAADGQARSIRANVATFKTQAEGFEFLFADLGQIVHKAADDFGLLVQARIDKHKADEAARLERERERIRAEEVARLAREAAAQQAQLEREQREAAAKAQREAEALAAKQRADADALARQQTAPPAAAPVKMTAFVEEGVQITTQPAPASQARVTHPAAQALRSEPPTLTLGEINARIAPLSISTAGLEELGYPATKVKAASMYRHADWPDIHAALMRCLAGAEVEVAA